MATTQVQSVRTVGKGTVAIDLETPPDFTAEPGQFVLVRATLDGDEYSRYYTISSPRVTDRFEMTVGVDPDGDLSPWLADRETGDELTIEGPFGNVFYAGDGPVLAIAGGPGIGPALAVAERALEEGQDAALIYQDDTPAHQQRLDALDSEGVSVTIVAGDDALQTAVAEQYDTGTPYVFGFEDFCERTLSAIEAAGGSPDDAEVESFG